MYEMTYGSKYEETQNLRTSQLAALFRQDVKAAQAAGELPAWMKVSVTTDVYSMGSAIRVLVRHDARLWERCDGFLQGTKREYAPGLHSGTACPTCNHAGEGHTRITAAAEAWSKLLSEMLFAYNYDGSESQVDYFHVRFHGTVSFESEFMAQCHASEAAARKARAARKAAA